MPLRQDILHEQSTAMKIRPTCVCTAQTYWNAPNGSKTPLQNYQGYARQNTQKKTHHPENPRTPQTYWNATREKARQGVQHYSDTLDIILSPLSHTPRSEFQHHTRRTYTSFSPILVRFPTRYVNTYQVYTVVPQNIPSRANKKITVHSYIYVYKPMPRVLVRRLL